MDEIAALAPLCRVATPRDVVTNAECVYTFHTPYTSPRGIVVNLATFVGTADGLAVASSSAAADDGAAPPRALCVRIAKERVARAAEDAAAGGGAAVKLGVGVAGGFRSAADKYDVVARHAIAVLGPGGVVVAEVPYDAASRASFPAEVARSADSVIHHAGLAVRQDLSAWELDDEPKPVSKYAAALPFVDNGVTVSPDPADWKCEKSGARDNLWLNLSDGFIGGGRQNWDGSGGSNGAVEHFAETGALYPLVVKLGTVTADVGTADCYSYAPDEDGPVTVPNLAELLARRGIRAAGMQKTVKSTAEMEVELNATYAFDAITEAGARLVPVAGPGLHGLQNLGNSCYVNSVAQLLFGGTVPELAARYGSAPDGGVAVEDHPLLRGVAPTRAADDLLCQATKLSCALTSGAFCGPAPASAAATDPADADPKHRLAPRMFKHAVGHDHVDFRTGQQQDAAQYFQHLLEKLDRAELGAGDRLGGADGAGPALVSSHLFSYRTESRVVCAADGRIKYSQGPPENMLSLPIAKSRTTTPDPDAPDIKRQKSEDPSGDDKEKESVPTITLAACLDEWSAATTIDDYRWPHLQDSVGPATSRTSFATFPRYLLMHMQRYELGEDWQPRKIEVDVDVPEEISLQQYRGAGPQEGEALVPEEADGAAVSAGAPAAPAIDEGALSQLMDMGFHMNGCKRALLAVGGSNVEAAMNWVFEHNADADFNDPLPEGGPSGSAAAPSDADVDEAVVTSLVDNLGCFTADQVRVAVKHCGGAADRAADWLFSHMADLNGAIAALESTSIASNSGPPSTTPLEDGDGKYNLIGLISHIGKNTGSGHYVAHLKKDGKWVIFNDEKVALSEHPPIRHAYMYLFQRSDTLGAPHPKY